MLQKTVLNPLRDKNTHTHTHKSVLFFRDSVLWYTATAVATLLLHNETKCFGHILIVPFQPQTFWVGSATLLQAKVLHPVER